MKRHALVSLGMLSAYGLTGQAPGAAAQDAQLPAIEVHAEASAEGKEIPIEQIRRNLATDVADVFKDEPSVAVGGGARNAQRIYLRGIEGSNLNITVDGARQGRNLHQHRGGIGGIDPDLLKRVEVDTGTAADRGPGALGGAIRFETVDAQDLLAAGRDKGATLKGGYASADRSWQGSATAYGRVAPDLALLAHVSAINREDYRIGGGGEVPNSAGKDRDYFLKLSRLGTDGHALRLSAERNTNAGLYLWGSHGSDMGYAPEDSVPVYQRWERNTLSLDHRFRSDNPLLDRRANVYRNQVSLEDQDRGTEVESDEIGGELRNTLRFALGATDHRLTIGADYFQEDGTSEDSAGASVDMESENLGLFIQDRMTLGRLGLSFGARFDDFSAEYGPHTLSGNRVSPNVNVDYEVARDWTLFAGYGEAVRGSGIIPVAWMARIDESTLFNDGQGLEPEESYRSEGGVRYQTSGLLRADDRVDAEVTVFNTRLRNTIERVGGGGGAVTAIINNPDTLHARGYEIRAGWGWRGYQTRLAFASVDLEDDDGEPAGIIRRKGAATGDRLVWDNRWVVREDFTLGYTLTAVGRLDEVPDGEEERPGYVLHDVQAEWQPRHLPGLTLALAIHNLFDRRYADQATIASSTTGIVEEPGRDVRLAASYRF
ncbi:TonB-dependent receptor domain-containing protein [Thiococcus pfennigii]|uniref:TonB-dependent receptor domain-containing protein n=1 Tax=Thiococcus pfennigii TaxID=1057 RepID=UPI0019036CB0|nr:TonB-dependent receptor [Thiococcus pfennigii]MBK1730503.1 TonB-dependent receptor [Thiococcus pfennigii]